MCATCISVWLSKYARTIKPFSTTFQLYDSFALLFRLQRNFSSDQLVDRTRFALHTHSTAIKMWMTVALNAIIQRIRPNIQHHFSQMLPSKYLFQFGAKCLQYCIHRFSVEMRQCEDVSFMDRSFIVTTWWTDDSALTLLLSGWDLIKFSYRFFVRLSLCALCYFFGDVFFFLSSKFFAECIRSHTHTHHINA